MPGPDDKVGHPEFATVQPRPVPVPAPVIEPFSACVAPPMPLPFEVFGAYWRPKSNPAICGDR